MNTAGAGNQEKKLPDVPGAKQIQVSSSLIAKTG
jgi:hypothetical protein